MNVQIIQSNTFIFKLDGYLDKSYLIEEMISIIKLLHYLQAESILCLKFNFL